MEPDLPEIPFFTTKNSRENWHAAVLDDIIRCLSFAHIDGLVQMTVKCSQLID